MNNRLKHKSIYKYSILLTLLLCFFSLWTFGQQMNVSIDSTSIKIGEQITYKIQVEADSTDLVVFPEGQTFLPLEVIESYKTDTTKNDAKFNLIKKLALIQRIAESFNIKTIYGAIELKRHEITSYTLRAISLPPGC